MVVFVASLILAMYITSVVVHLQYDTPMSKTEHIINKISIY